MYAESTLKTSIDRFAYQEYLHLPGKTPERIITGYMSADDAWAAEVCTYSETILLF